MNMDRIVLVALVVTMIVILCGLYYVEAQKPPLTVAPVIEKTTVNVLCIEGYEYIQDTVGGPGAFGTIYTQRFINTDNGLQAKICRNAEEGIDADTR